MNNDNIVEEFKACTNKINGMVQPNVDPSPPSDNGILFTSEALHVLYQNEALSQEVFHFYLMNILKCKVEPGLYRRNPWGGPINQQDDYIGICSLIAIESSLKYYAEEIYQYGRRNWWFFNDRDPGKRTTEAWFGKWIYLPSFIKACTGRWLTPWNTLVLSANFIEKALNPSQDACMLGWLMAQPLKNRNFIVKLSIKFFMNKYKKKYPNGVYECFKEYSVQPLHPLSKYWKWE